MGTLKTTFSPFDISAMLGIHTATLREWTANGWIKPSVASGGRGQAAIFSRRDVYRVHLFQELIAAGVTRAYAGDLLSQYDFLGVIKPSREIRRCLKRFFNIDLEELEEAVDLAIKML